VETRASVPDGTVGPMKLIEMAGPGGGWRVRVPETRWERMRGLRGHPPPGRREAMLFLRCRSVQTFGMKAAISVAFLDRSMRVIELRRCPPGIVVRAGRPDARHALECDVASGLRIGDRIRPAARAAR
jgi:hypothetical protein